MSRPKGDGLAGGKLPTIRTRPTTMSAAKYTRSRDRWKQRVRTATIGRAKVAPTIQPDCRYAAWLARVSSPEVWKYDTQKPSPRHDSETDEGLLTTAALSVWNGRAASAAEP